MSEPDLTPADDNGTASEPDEGGTSTPGESSAATPSAEPSRSRTAGLRGYAVVVLAVLLVVGLIFAAGYYAGLGPLNNLSTKRSLRPPNALGGLGRITDQETRTRLQLDEVRDTLAQTNDGNRMAVEAYGDVTGGAGLFIVIALRGKVDIDQAIKESGATGDEVRTVGKSTCATTPAEQVITCFRGSNTLTVMVRDGTGKANADRVGGMTDEAFDAFK
jgi:hypothetical protein